MALSLAHLLKAAHCHPQRVFSRAKPPKHRRNASYTTHASYRTALESAYASSVSTIRSRMSRWWTVAPFAAAGLWATTSDPKEEQKGTSATASTATPAIVLRESRNIVRGLKDKLQGLMESVAELPDDVFHAKSKFVVASCEQVLKALKYIQSAEAPECIAFLYSACQRLNAETKYPELLTEVYQADSTSRAASGDYDKAVQLMNDSVSLTDLKLSGNDKLRFNATAYFGIAAYSYFAGHVGPISPSIKQSTDCACQLLQGRTLTSDEAQRWTEFFLRYVRMARYVKERGDSSLSEDFSSAAKRIHAALKSSSPDLHPYEIYVMLEESEGKD